MTITTTGIAGTIIPALDSDIVAGLLDNGHRKASSPLQVRYRQGVKEVLEMISERIGISMSELTCILVEDALRGMLLPLSTTAGNVTARVEQLIKAHSLTPPALAHLLSPWNVRLSVLQDPVKMTDYLSPALLDNLAQWFHVNPDWLSGRVNFPVALSGCWPETQEAFHALLQDDNTDVIIWHSILPPGNDGQEYTGVLLRRKTVIHGTTIYPVLSLPPVNIKDNRTAWINEFMDNHCSSSVRRVSLPPYQAELLMSGRIFPAIFMQTSLPG
ncbi:conjugal transfer protein TraE [Salmonella enterica]|nr:conjugal transfer protein TraE [Salmonella enterica subsp. diarizonae serovar 42:l,v:1,5,7]MDJ6851376.1 conjugal transfer protein TraE [Salmonella enterica]